MGICNVLAVIPFLCSAPAEPPQDPDQQVIESAPSENVEVGTLIAPDGGVYNPSQDEDTTAEPSMRRVSDYQVLPPQGDPDVTYTPQPANAPASSNTAEANTFSEWVSQNWGSDTNTDADSSEQ